MKYLFLLSFLLSTSVNAQTNNNQPSPFTYNPNYQNKFKQFDTRELKSFAFTLESKKNKNFTIDHQSLLAGTDLKAAEEYENKINYGVKTIGGGVFSLNAIDQKLYGSTQNNQALGMSYNLSSRYSSILFSYKKLDTLNTNLKGLDTNIMELKVKASF